MPHEPLWVECYTLGDLVVALMRPRRGWVITQGGGMSAEAPANRRYRRTRH